MRGWEAAIEAQVDLYKFWSSSHGAASARAWGRVLGKGLSPSDAGSLEAYRQIDQLEQVKLHRADPFYVASDMLDVIEAAHDSFQEEPFVETDLLTQFGFVLMPSAHFGIDATGHSISFRAFGWSPVIEAQDPFALGTDAGKQRTGIWLSFYSHIDDLAVEAKIDEEQGLGTAASEAEYEWRKASSVSDFGTPFALLHAMPIWFGMTPDGLMAEAILKANYTPEHARASVLDWWRFVQVFFRLTMQYLSTRDRYQPPRATRKRVARAKIEKDYVTVIRLRRPRAKPSGKERHVEWTHRWIVGSFWRNQWYPSLGIHRQILIAEHVRGPEDKPLVIRKGRAFELVR